MAVEEASISIHPRNNKIISCPSYWQRVTATQREHHTIDGPQRRRSTGTRTNNAQCRLVQRRLTLIRGLPFPFFLKGVQGTPSPHFQRPSDATPPWTSIVIGPQHLFEMDLWYLPMEDPKGGDTLHIVIRVQGTVNKVKFDRPIWPS